MSLIGLIVWIALVGLVVWLITNFIPMDQRFKNAIVIVAVAVVILIVLNAFGLLDLIDRPVPRLR